MIKLILKALTKKIKTNNRSLIKK